MDNKSTGQQAPLATNDRDSNQLNTIVNVSVAVLYYQQRYLLGFRNSSQHQGNLYEFVGGKIDANESAVAALIREVSEETAIDISTNVAVKLGRLHHDYGDKQVCLQVYKVALSTEQYEQHQYISHGVEGQALTWVNEASLLAGEYLLPAANQTILSWLRLPELISITYPLAHFDDQQDIQKSWLDYHVQHIVKDAWIYARPKHKSSESLTEQLLALRPDIYIILPNKDSLKLINKTGDTIENQAISNRVSALHLSHNELIQWFDDYQDNVEDIQLLALEHPLIISCHDAGSIEIANKLAAIRLQHSLSPVIGIFLAPVLATATHPDTTPLGWQAWSALAQLAAMPVIGLGGLAPSALATARQQGATSIAGIRQFLSA